MDQGASCYGGRPRPRQHCVRWGPAPPERGTGDPLSFWSMSIVAKRLPISATDEHLFSTSGCLASKIFINCISVVRSAADIDRSLVVLPRLVYGIPCPFMCLAYYSGHFGTSFIHTSCEVCFRALVNTQSNEQWQIKLVPHCCLMKGRKEAEGWDHSRFSSCSCLSEYAKLCTFR